jgi:predicted TIM-barrel fold metal-dependent hydrolase
MIMSRRNFGLSLISTGIGMSTRSARAENDIVAIDTHAHVFTRSLKLAGQRRYAPDYDASIADYIAMSDRNGMSQGVLIQPSFLGTDNTYLLEALHQYSQRLRGIVVVETGIGKEELAALDRSGVVGVRLNLLGQTNPDFASPGWQQFLGYLVALRWQVELQAEAGRLPAIIPPLLQAGVTRVVVDHFGRPDPKLGIDDPGFRFLLSSSDSGCVWVKLSGAYRNGDTAEAAARSLLRSFGPTHLVWGSDWPHTQFETVASPEAARKALDIWVPDLNDRHAILTDTPAKLFRFFA